MTLQKWLVMTQKKDSGHGPILKGSEGDSRYIYIYVYIYIYSAVCVAGVRVQATTTLFARLSARLTSPSRWASVRSALGRAASSSPSSLYKKRLANGTHPQIVLRTWKQMSGVNESSGVKPRGIRSFLWTWNTKTTLEMENNPTNWYMTLGLKDKRKKIT